MHSDVHACMCTGTYTFAQMCIHIYNTYPPTAYILSHSSVFSHNTHILTHDAHMHANTYNRDTCISIQHRHTYMPAHSNKCTHTQLCAQVHSHTLPLTPSGCPALQWTPFLHTSKVPFPSVPMPVCREQELPEAADHSLLSASEAQSDLC